VRLGPIALGSVNLPHPPHLRSDPAEAPLAADPSVEIRVKMPRLWRDQLQAAAGVRAITMSSLVRIIFRDFLRESDT